MKNLFGLMVILGLASTTVAQVNPAGQAATVWFYRPADSPAPKELPTVHKVGGLTQQLGKIAPGEFFGYPVTAGTHVFSYTRAPARGQSLSLEFKSGEQIFVEVQFRDFKRVPAGDGIEAIAKTQPVPEARVLHKIVLRKFEPVSLASIMPANPNAVSKPIILPPSGAPLTVIPLPSNSATASSVVAAPVRSTASITRTAPVTASAPVASSRSANSTPGDAALKLDISMTPGPVSLGSPFVAPVVSVGAASRPSVPPTVSTPAAPAGAASASRPASAPASSSAPVRRPAAAPPAAANAKAVTPPQTAPVTRPSAPPISPSASVPSASNRPASSVTSAAASTPSVAARAVATPVAVATAPVVTSPASQSTPPLTAPAATARVTPPVSVPAASVPAAIVAPVTPPAAQPLVASRTEPAPVTRVNQPRPVWPEQPVSFYEVFQKATLQAVEKKQYVEAMVAFDRNYFWVLDVRGNTVKAFPYSDIKSAEYSYARSVQWTAIAPGAPASSSAGGNRHWFMVQTQNDYVLLQLDKENYRSAVRAFEIRAGQKVETETGEIN